MIPILENWFTTALFDFIESYHEFYRYTNRYPLDMSYYYCDDNFGTLAYGVPGMC